MGKLCGTQNFGTVDDVSGPTPSMGMLPMSRAGGPPPSTVIDTVMKPRNLVASFLLSPEIFNNFSMFSTINPRGVLKFYAQSDLPLKVESNIGCYGYISIFIKQNSS